jgi:hydrogenase expression/formation protein HypD
MNKLDEIKDYLRTYDQNELTIMEVCGTHTSAIIRGGIRQILSDKIRLVSGPGCPVCVTEAEYVDKLCEIGSAKDNVIVTFGDMMKVKGNRGSLYDARAKGADVRIVYSPLDIIEMAKRSQDKNFIMAAVGFETTQPVYALLLDEVIKAETDNIFLLTSMKKIIPALRYICEEGNSDIDGFIAPGHVSTVIGLSDFEKLSSEFKKPFAVAGFTIPDILYAIYDIVVQSEQIQNGEYSPESHNLYTGVVRSEGNTKAQELINKYFEICDSNWRAIGIVPKSGIKLKKEYEKFDANIKFSQNEIGNGNESSTHADKIDSLCRCSDVILGRAIPLECQLFAVHCSPENPIGPCMVSSEGSCGIYFREEGI